MGANESKYQPSIPFHQQTWEAIRAAWFRFTMDPIFINNSAKRRKLMCEFDDDAKEKVDAAQKKLGFCLLPQDFEDHLNCEFRQLLSKATPEDIKLWVDEVGDNGESRTEYKWLSRKERRETDDGMCYYDDRKMKWYLDVKGKWNWIGGVPEA